MLISWLLNNFGSLKVLWLFISSVVFSLPVHFPFQHIWWANCNIYIDLLSCNKLKNYFYTICRTRVFRAPHAADKWHEDLLMCIALYRTGRRKASRLWSHDHWPCFRSGAWLVTVYILPSLSACCVTTEPVFVDLLRRPGIDSQPVGPVRNLICRTGPPGYIGWRNRFLGIDSWAP